MSHTTALLDRYKAHHGIATDSQAGQMLRLSKQAISSYRHELRHAEPETVRAMAIAIGEDPDIWTLKVQAERETVPERKKVWLRCAARLAAVTEAAMIALPFAESSLRGLHLSIMSNL